MWLKTFDEMCEDETICDYCKQTDYGESKFSTTPTGYWACEGSWCETSYESYLDECESTENLVKYQNNVILLNKGELNWGLH